ncbi:MAG: MFS transporter, partial [Solirubrobacteraceae bacterium]
LFGSIFPIGGMLGPIFGGLFVSYWSWRGVFFVNVPIGMLLIVLCFRYIPHDPPLGALAHDGLDFAGMTMLGVGVLGAMLGVAHLGERGATVGSAMFIAPILVAIVAVVVFVRHLGRSAKPFIAPRLIYGARFGPINLINAIFGGITLAVIALIPLYAANRYRLDALDAGTLLVAEGVAAITLSVLGAMLLRRSGYRPPLYGGCVAIALGIVMLALRPIGMPPYLWLMLGAFVVGIGAGAINPASRNAGLQLAPQDSATIAALRSMFLQIGAITTISIATAIIAKSGDSGTVQAWIYVALAAVMVAALPLIKRVPEHHGAW